jgi:hypothetical protein
MRFSIVCLLTAGFFTFSGAARADILITVDKSAQRLTVSEDGQTLYNWPVSTGMTGRATPSGSFRAFRMEADHFSKEWDDAPMPYSIFFTKVGHAIHGTNSTSKLGLPVSHGCVRLSVAHAQKLFALVKQEGVLKTKVVLTGSEQVALKRHRAQMLAAKENPAPRQPRPATPPRDPEPQTQYGEAQPAEPVYGDAQPPEEQFEQPQYSEQRPQYDERRYADRPYGEPQYVNPNYSYGAREYRPQPQYMQPQYTPPANDDRSRYGIY